MPGATLIAKAEWSQGQVCVLDQRIAPGLLVPAHRHDRETQLAYVVSGTITFYVDGREEELSAGGLVVRPPGSVHALWNATDAQARMIEITTPASQWQAFALELQKLLDRAGSQHELVELSGRYGTHLEPAVTDELTARLGLSVSRGYSAE